MKKTCLASASRSILVVIDVQEKLLPAIRRGERLIQNVRFLMQAAEILRVPILISEQYPQGLGPTVPEIRQSSQSSHYTQKTRFSASRAIESWFAEHAGRLVPNTGEEDRQQLRHTGSRRNQVILCGIETHICVGQTALELLASEYQTFVVSDAVSSRHRADHRTGLRRMRDAGCTVASSESIVFEWCECAGTDAFREISRLTKQRDQERRLNNSAD